MNSPNMNDNTVTSELQMVDSPALKKAESSLSRFKLFFTTIAQTIDIEGFCKQAAIALEKSSELQVKVKRNSRGQTFWQVYDPITSRSLKFATQDELLTWIKQRHHHCPNDAASHDSHLSHRWSR